MTEKADIEGVFTYPFKSGKPFEGNQFETNAFGFEHDRIVMAAEYGRSQKTTANHLLVSQRKHAELALIKTSIVGHQLVLSVDGHDDLFIPLDPHDVATLQIDQIEVHGKIVPGLDLGDPAAEWINQFIHSKRGTQTHEMRLFHRAQGELSRLVDLRFVGKDQTPEVNFSDGFPFLVTSTASLQAVNEHCQFETPVEMARFRPNIVLEGNYDPFFEERLRAIAINGVVIELVKPCTRCVMINNTPSDGSKDSEKRRLFAKLMEMPGRAQTIPKSDESGYVFGMNGIQTKGFGESIKVGDEVELIWKD